MILALTHFFLINPYNNAPNTSLQCASSDLNEISIDEVFETNPLIFKRVRYKIFNFLCSDRQIICDSIRSCCDKFGKINLRRMWKKNLSLNGDEKDTFLNSHMQLVRDQGTGATLTHVEYFLDLSIKCCRAAFKIAHSIGKMRLQKIQKRMVKRSWIPFYTNASGGKGIIGHHCINWMHVYFSKHCDIAPTTGRSHL